MDVYICNMNWRLKTTIQRCKLTYTEGRHTGEYSIHDLFNTTPPNTVNENNLMWGGPTLVRGLWEQLQERRSAPVYEASNLTNYTIPLNNSEYSFRFPSPNYDTVSANFFGDPVSNEDPTDLGIMSFWGQRQRVEEPLLQMSNNRSRPVTSEDLLQAFRRETPPSYKILTGEAGMRIFQQALRNLSQ